MPPALARRFTVSELAVLKIVSDEHRHHGACDRSLGQIAAPGRMLPQDRSERPTARAAARARHGADPENACFGPMMMAPPSPGGEASTPVIIGLPQEAVRKVSDDRAYWNHVRNDGRKRTSLHFPLRRLHNGGSIALGSDPTSDVNLAFHGRNRCVAQQSSLLRQCCFCRQQHCLPNARKQRPRSFVRDCRTSRAV
jgi:hypothetical protein